MRNKNDYIKFEQDTDGLFNVSTNQKLDADNLVKRVVNMEIRKTNMKMQIDFTEKQIEDAMKDIDAQKVNISNMKTNIGLIDEDLNEAYSFLKKIHREDLVVKIAKDVEDKKKEYPQAQPAPSETSGGENVKEQTNKNN